MARNFKTSWNILLGKSLRGLNPLFFFLKQNFLTTVAILLEAGAFVNVQQNNGETALMKVNASLGALPTPPHTLPQGSMFSTGPPTATTGAGGQPGQDHLWTWRGCSWVTETDPERWSYWVWWEEAQGVVGSVTWWPSFVDSSWALEGTWQLAQLHPEDLGQLGWTMSVEGGRLCPVETWAWSRWMGIRYFPLVTSISLASGFLICAWIVEAWRSSPSPTHSSRFSGLRCYRPSRSWPCVEAVAPASSTKGVPTKGWWLRFLFWPFLSQADGQTPRSPWAGPWGCAGLLLFFFHTWGLKLVCWCSCFIFGS